MKPDTVQIFQPFEIHIDPMERLLLVNFEKDPDSIYLGFEPQVFDDPIHGKGHLIIGWRVDKKVDVYHQPTLTLNPDTYDIAGKGLENMVKTTFLNATYEIDRYGVQAHYSFNDINNRSIIIKINEKNPKNRKPFGLLAPMGDAAEHPSALPLVYLHDFYFVRKNHTEIEISIDGKKHKPDLLPLPMDLAKMYFTRYSPQPLIATLNPSYSGKLLPLYAERNQKKISNEEYEVGLQWRNNDVLIKRIIRKNKIYPVTLEFQDPFPNLSTVQNDRTLKGNFSITANPKTGRIAGNYSVNRKNDEIGIVLIPAGGWKPRPTKISLWLLYSLAKLFKQWSTSYKWTAKLTREKNESFFMESKWERTNTPQPLPTSVRDQ